MIHIRTACYENQGTLSEGKSDVSGLVPHGY